MTSYYPRKNKYSRTYPVLYLKHKIILPGLLLTVMVLSSCEEKSTTIGINLLPESDFVHIKSTDTIAVESYSIYYDSVYSSNKTYSYFGGLYDPYFGNTFSDFVTQLRLLKKYSGGVPIVDSVKLLISIVGAKGEYGIDSKLMLYEVTEQLSSDSAYYSNKDPRAGLFLGSYQLPVISKDTAYSFILNMPVWIGEYLLRDTTKLNQDKGPNDFRAFFKGLYVTVEAGTVSGKKGAVPNIPLIMTLAYNEKRDCAIRVYYHTNKSSDLTFDFIINDNNNVRYNRYLHDFTTGEPGKKIQHINDGFKDTLSYIQGFYGILTKIKFPELEKVKTIMPVSVNRVKLTFSVYFDEDIYKSTTIPTRIFMSFVTSTGKKSIVPDYYVSSSFFDGTFNSVKKSYSFNLSAFAQEYLEGKISSPEVEMYFPEGEYRNVILKANNSTSPVKFELVYTQF